MCVFWKFHLLFKQIVCALKAAFSLVNVFVLFDIFGALLKTHWERENERKFYLRFALTSKCLSLTKIVYDIETHKQQFERISLVFIAVRNISKSGSDQRNRLLLIIHSRALLHQCLLNAVSLRFWFSSLSCIWSSFKNEMRTKRTHYKSMKSEKTRKESKEEDALRVWGFCCAEIRAFPLR